MKTKKLLSAALSTALMACLCACTQKTTEKKGVPASATVQDYPYTIKHPDNWEVGNPANTLVVLNSLKAWEQGKMDESLKNFGDSVRVQFDGVDKKMSNDSLKVFLGAGWNKSIKIKMDDWESVISKDKSEEWVTIWYRQLWETPQGVKDSTDVINDLQLKNGKIVRLSEHTRKFH
jgi:hypothetical protein